LFVHHFGPKIAIYSSKTCHFGGPRGAFQPGKSKEKRKKSCPEPSRVKSKKKKTKKKLQLTLPKMDNFQKKSKKTETSQKTKKRHVPVTSRQKARVEMLLGPKRKVQKSRLLKIREIWSCGHFRKCAQGNCLDIFLPEISTFFYFCLVLPLPQIIYFAKHT
jgi:hypothetical protein